MKTFRLLKREEPDRQAIEKLVGRKSDDILLGAIANPEHSEAARGILRELAGARGLGDALDEGWEQTEDAMFVAPFGSRPGYEEALAAPDRRRRLYRFCQAGAIGGILTLLVAGAAAPELIGFGTVLAIIGVLLWSVVAVYSWTNPIRILLLRPFHSKETGRSLNRFVNSNLAFHGHTFTCADRYVKESRLLFFFQLLPRSPVEIAILPLLFIPPVRQLLRWVKVSGPWSYAFLKKRMARRFTLNWFWQNSWNKILKVRSSDVWWQQCIDLFMYSCHLIVVDLSWVKAGTKWELRKLDTRDLERKCLLVVVESKADYAHNVVAEFWPSDEPPPPLYVYRKSGKLLDPGGFRRDIAKIVNESHLWAGSNQF